jgi:hypothetical protein
MQSLEKNQINIAEDIPLLEKIEKRFAFIHDVTLRRNISIAFQYVSFLTLLPRFNIENTTVASLIHKDMIIYTATILESILHYCLKEYLVKNKEKHAEIMRGDDWQFKNCKELYTISADEQVCGVIRYKKVERLTDQTNFMVINRACKKAGILSIELFDKAEKIRQWRNNIHLGSLISAEDGYTKIHSQEAFDIAKAIIPVVEDQLI